MKIFIMTKQYAMAVRKDAEIFCLNIYIDIFLEILAYAGKFAYYVVSLTGNWFRSHEVFASTFEEGVLKNAEINLEKSGIVALNKIRPILKEYLYFESRFALENVWIRKNYSRQIIQAFDQTDLKHFKKFFQNGNYIVAIPHNTAIYMLVSLVAQLKESAPILVTNPLSFNIKKPTPVQKSIIKLFSVWPKHQELLFIEKGNIFDRSCAVLKSGKSLIIAPDTPFTSKKKVYINFMGRKTEVGPGAAVMAQRCKVPVMAVVPWAKNCTDPYKLNIKIIDAKDISKCMCDIFNFFQTTIEMNPACWSGWLYWDKLNHRTDIE